MHKPEMDAPTAPPEADSPTLTGASHATEALEGQETQSGGTATHQPPTPTPASMSQSAPEDAFRPGDLVAGRYKVERFIARGGMGEVYQAQDTTLGGSVALKTIRARVASDQRAIERFKREILLARQVTHPNVSRIFDIERHAPSTTQPATLFLTMELLPGTTLRQHIREHGKLSTAQALPILQQMARGLAAAHKAGIVHRDFKSANVMLVPSPQGSTRAVVTDFGLARLDSHQPEEPQPPPEPQQPPPHQDENPFASLTGSGSVVGTPAYMAPEQVLGQKATAAADIYALGVVLFEMVTGALPFASASSMSTATERLKRKAPSPRELVAELDPAWERVILKCMERNPSERYQSVEELLEALKPPQTPLVQTLPPPRSRMVAAAALLAVLLVSSAFIVSRTLSPPARRSIAVLGFQNQASPQDAWLSTALSEMLRPELAASPSLRLIQPETVARVKTELGLPEAASYSKDALQKLKLNLGAELLVVGSYRRQASRLLWQVALQNSATGERLEPLSQDAPESDLFSMVSGVAERLRGQLGADRPPPQALESVHAANPVNQEALRLYAQGLDQLRVFENNAAKEFFEQAIAADENFAAAYVGLSRAQSILGNRPAAREAARHAFELSQKLSREEALWAEAFYRESNSELPEAIKIFQSLFNYQPETLEYGLRLAQLQLGAGKIKEAQKTIEELKALPPAMSHDLRIMLVEAELENVRGNTELMLKTSQNALQSALNQGARLIACEALETESWAYYYQGDLKSSIKKAEEAKKIALAVGDRGHVADILLSIATNYGRLGNLEQAKEIYLQAKDIFVELGYETSMPRMLYNFANCLIRIGDLKEAESTLEEFSQFNKKVNDNYFEKYSHISLAWLLQSQGRFPAARDQIKQAIHLLKEAGDEAALALAQWKMGQLLMLQGNKQEALEFFENSLKLRERNKLTLFAAESQVSIAEIECENGQFDQAEARTRAALATFAQSHALDNQAWALTVLTDILIARKELEQAKKSGLLAVELAKASESLDTRIRGVLLEKRLFEAIDQTDSAQLTNALTAALHEATAAGMAPRRIELAIALAEFKARDNPAIAETELAKLRQEAIELGSKQ